VPLPVADGTIAAVAVALLVAINCAGVRAGSTVQSVLMVLKIAAILSLVGCALVLGAPAPATRPPAPDNLASLGAAMVAVVFAYGGWQTSCFVASEMTDPRKNLPRALVIGVVGVITLYTLVVLACLRTLGADELGRSSAPALAVMT